MTHFYAFWGRDLRVSKANFKQDQSGHLEIRRLILLSISCSILIDFFDLYRELDRGTMYFRNHLNQTVLKGVAINKDNIDEALVSKVLLKSIVYRLINKVETFMDFGGIPDLETFDEFLGFIRY